MQQRLVIRYSMSFKRQVVSELESGRFDSIGQANEHYGIAGAETIRSWLRISWVRSTCVLTKGIMI